MRLIILLIALPFYVAPASAVTHSDTARSCPEECLAGYGLIPDPFNSPLDSFEDPHDVMLQLVGLNPRTATRQVEEESICRAIRKGLERSQDVQAILRDIPRSLVYTLHQLGPYYIAAFRSEHPRLSQGRSIFYVVFDPNAEYMGTFMRRIP
jgi:hypothetical protein